MILSLDIGTSSVRAIAFKPDGIIQHSTQKEYQQHYPRPGWVEQSADEIIEDAISVAKRTLQQCRENQSLPTCLGITNQRESIVVWDRNTGKPIFNAIIWQDTRTSVQCLAFEQHNAQLVREKTGLLIDPYFSATKIAWILDNVEGARAAAERGDLYFGTIDTYVIYCLTEGTEHITDATNASRTLLYNVRDHFWDETLFKLFNIPMSMAPKVVDSAGLHAVTSKNILGEHIDITGIAGDQQAATFGQCCFNPGDVKATFGTGCFALLNIGEEFRLSEHKLLTTIAYQLNGKATYALEGSIFAAGTVVNWLKHKMQLIDTAAETEAACASINSNEGVYFVPAFNGLGAPHWRSDVNGAISGVSMSTTRAHFIRAGIEGVVYQVHDLLEAMRHDFSTLSQIRVDGGMTKNAWMMQFLADITQLKIDQSYNEETSAMGAAFLAGLGKGVYKDLDEIHKIRQSAQIFKHNLANETRETYLAGWRDALARCLTN